MQPYRGPKDWSPAEDAKKKALFNENEAYADLTTLLADLKPKYPEIGLTFGYIGNLDMRHDDRSWMFFTQVPIQGTWGLDRMHFGGYPTADLPRFAKEALNPARGLENWIKTRALPRLKQEHGGTMSGPKDWTPLPTCSSEVAENIAAIATNIGLSKNHMKAYDAAANHMGGFTGFYVVGAEMGVALGGYAKRHHIVWGTNAEWIGTTMALAEAILDFMIANHRLPETDAERNALIESSIERN